ncbi:hypothetical protein RGUI_0817 [Rhodovulum sp. P5]|uniref:hypothetical protein n=1 Tax=Rhodovulum phage vB_RhkS_P1 TaxID=1873452 RepID=UPI00080AA8CF|nr:hypothetical protein [Rhodovulum sp. P5]YP_009285902.1 hypothetical protein BI026_gp17 [Rhodovulum phage vB_RhkS_P1]ANT39887.1 hypothetical protein Rhks_17 [Rhodovulum phage vB_RhkS_P1]ARE38958.1 hypothetical protein RGUI_0817 [Rhodovulum sp. P5]
MIIEHFSGTDLMFGLGRTEGAIELYLGRRILRFGPPLGTEEPGPAEDGLRPVLSGLDMAALRKGGL